MVSLLRVTGLTVLVELIAVVVVVSGATKVGSPGPFADLTSSMGLRIGRPGARIVGVAEIALGAWVLAVGGRLACAVLAGSYAVFAMVVVLARRNGAASCGCFGAAAAPPSMVHVVVNLVSAAVAALGAATGDVTGIATALGDQPLAGVPYLLLLGTGAWLVVAVDTVGASVLESSATLSTMGPVFRENSTKPNPSRTTHHHQGADAPR